MRDRTSEYAYDLKTAGPWSLAFVDREGRVRGRAYRLVPVMYYLVVGGLIAAEAVLGYQAFGLPGLSIAAGLGALAAYAWRPMFALKRALQLIQHDQLDLAEELVRKHLRRRILNRRVRGRLHAVLASVLNRRGQLEEALASTREANRLSGGGRTFHARHGRYAEVNLLARLGRTAEAREALVELGPEIPDGEVFRLSHYTTELLLAFHEGAHDLDDEALHERASFALAITVASPTLALLAWAFEKSGDLEMAELLASEARDRPGDLVKKLIPEVATWLEERSGRALPEVRVADSFEEAEAHELERSLERAPGRRRV